MANVKGLAVQQTIRKLAERGVSQRQIAKMLGISRNTVANYIPEGIQTEPPGERVPAGSDVQTEPPSERVPAGSGAIPARSQSKCLPYQQIIEEKVELGLQAARIHQDLVYEHQFKGSYDSVKRFVRKLTGGSDPPHRRMESLPGYEAQVDFGKGAWTVDENGRRRKTHMLRVILSNSRKGYTEVVRRQDTESFIRALENAFRHFGGVPTTVVPDNLKAAVLMADKYDPELNPKFKSFAEHYNVAVLPTPPRRPELKGKVERGVGYAYNRALKGRTFPSLEKQNKHLRWWEETVADTRIHGTTQKQVRAAFEQEKPFLQPLPETLFPCFKEGQRVVSRDGHVEVEKAFYSAPPEFLGRTVWVRWDSREVRIFHPRDFRQVRIHARLEPGRFSTNDADISEQRISNLEHGRDYLLRKLEAVDPDLHAWALAMLKVRGIAGVRVVQGVLNLSGKVEIIALAQAARQATQLQVWTLRELRQLAARADVEPHPELPLTQEAPIIRDLGDYSVVLGNLQTGGSQ